MAQYKIIHVTEDDRLSWWKITAGNKTLADHIPDEFTAQICRDALERAENNFMGDAAIGNDAGSLNDAAPTSPADNDYAQIVMEIGNHALAKVLFYD